MVRRHCVFASSRVEFFGEAQGEQGDAVKAFLAFLLLSSGAEATGYPACPFDHVEYENVTFKSGHPYIVFGMLNGMDDHRYITVLLINQKDKRQNGTWTTPDYGTTWWRLSGCWQGALASKGDG